MSFIRGRVDRVLHSSGTFHVLLFEIIEHSGFEVPRTTKAAGDIFGLAQISSGTVLQLDGVWADHQKYGRQFKITGWTPWAHTVMDVVPFLALALRLPVDIPLLDRMADEYGTSLYTVLGTDELLSLATAPDQREIFTWVNAIWLDVLAKAKLFSVLQKAYGLNAAAVVAVLDHFGLTAQEVLTANPYRLVEVEGMSFGKVDKLARSLGIGVDDPRRLSAGVIWALREHSKDGHLYASQRDVERLLRELSTRHNCIGFDPEELGAKLDNAIRELEGSSAVKREPGAGLYLEPLHRYERESARILSSLMPEAAVDMSIESFLQAYERDHGIVLSDQQRTAVSQVLNHRVLVVTGAPGTGKTTLVRAFVHLYRMIGISHMLMAPTGIAAKRLGSVTGTNAKTVHRSLGYDGMSWGYGGDRKLATKAVIVDECSMLDQELFYRLLSALEPRTLVVLVGDDAQLPSVGPGNVLRELIGCGKVPLSRLNVVFRQAETSDIVRAAHHVKAGLSPLEMDGHKGQASEFQFVPIQDEAAIADLIVRMAKKLKDRNANFQVLAPKYEGTVGVNQLNTLLQDALNPDVGQPTFEGLDFTARLGDRLMVVKNDYRLNVFNGDIGKLVHVTETHLHLRIHAVGTEGESVVEIPVASAAGMLKLAYALTVHRCQGEEFGTVIMPVVRSQGRMLQRNLFYTALTRAKQKVWLLGDPVAVRMAVANDKVVERNTVLGSLIVEPAATDC